MCELFLTAKLSYNKIVSVISQQSLEPFRYIHCYNKMSTFTIVQKGKSLCIVPENWIVLENGVENVIWPRENSAILVKCAESQPALDGPGKWCNKGKYTVKRRNIPSWKMASKELKQMIAKSDTEEDAPISKIVTRGNQYRNRKLMSASATVPTFNLPDKIFATPPTTKAAKKIVVTTPLSSRIPSTASSLNNSPISSRTSSPAMSSLQQRVGLPASNLNDLPQNSRINSPASSLSNELIEVI